MVKKIKNEMFVQNEILKKKLRGVRFVLFESEKQKTYDVYLMAQLDDLKEVLYEDKNVSIDNLDYVVERYVDAIDYLENYYDSFTLFLLKGGC